MVKIPLVNMHITAFPDHSWRFGPQPKAFYVTINDENALYTKSENSMSEQLLQILRQTTDKDKIQVFIFFLKLALEFFEENFNGKSRKLPIERKWRLSIGYDIISQSVHPAFKMRRF